MKLTKLALDSYYCQLAQYFTALSSEIRLKIIDIIGSTSRTAGEIAELLGESKSVTSHHLKVLSHIGIIEGIKTGRNTFYVIRNFSAVTESIECLAELTK